MKYLIVPYIALGLMLAMPFGLTYYCSGSEMFPEYFGSPFVFKQKSLASSMTYYYSISGVLLNVLVWSTIVLIVRFLLLRFQKNFKRKKLGENIYKAIVIIMIAFSSLFIYVNWVMMGGGFEKGRNYWYMNLDEEAENWKMECEGKWGIFGN